jgi:type II secretory pathway pseudopilin PulG
MKNFKLPLPAPSELPYARKRIKRNNESRGLLKNRPSTPLSLQNYRPSTQPTLITKTSVSNSLGLKNAFTLVETLLYIALSSIFLTFFITSFFTISALAQDDFLKLVKIKELEFLKRKIELYVRDSEITSPILGETKNELLLGNNFLVKENAGQIVLIKNESGIEAEYFLTNSLINFSGCEFTRTSVLELKCTVFNRTEKIIINI